MFSHGWDHIGKTSGFGQVINDLTTCDSHIVILIDEQQFNDHKNIVYVWTDHIIQLVEHPIDNFDKQVMPDPQAYVP